jgi:hypothetical protein
MSAAMLSTLVLDASARQALAAVRALGRAGLDVGAAGYEQNDLARDSRRASRSHRLPDPASSGDVFHSALDGLLAAHGYDVVVATDDATIARLRERPPRVPCVPDVRATRDALGDKLELARIAGDAGVAYPETLAVGPATAVERTVEALGLPVVVKASTSARLVDGRVHAHAGAVLATTREGVRDAVDDIRRAGLTPIAQRPAERAEKIDVAIVRGGGRSEVRLAYRVLRDVPLTGGLAVTLETVPSSTGSGREALEALERVCDDAGYEGIANGEFCVGADGTTTLIEVNARPWASMWFAERLGQGVAERSVRLAAGAPPLPPAPLPGRRRYHHVAGELQWASLHDRLAPRLAELAATMRPRDVYEYDDLRDPWPLLRHALRRAAPRLSPYRGHVSK